MQKVKSEDWRLFVESGGSVQNVTAKFNLSTSLNVAAKHVNTDNDSYQSYRLFYQLSNCLFNLLPAFLWKPTWPTGVWAKVTDGFELLWPSLDCQGQRSSKCRAPLGASPIPRQVTVRERLFIICSHNLRDETPAANTLTTDTSYNNATAIFATTTIFTTSSNLLQLLILRILLLLLILRQLLLPSLVLLLLVLLILLLLYCNFCDQFYCYCHTFSHLLLLLLLLIPLLFLLLFLWQIFATSTIFPPLPPHTTAIFAATILTATKHSLHDADHTTQCYKAENEFVQTPVSTDTI